MNILGFLVRLVFIYLILNFFIRVAHFLIRLFIRRSTQGGGKSGVRKTGKNESDVIDAEYKEIE